jgi:hypothetical protein
MFSKLVDFTVEEFGAVEYPFESLDSRRLYPDLASNRCRDPSLPTSAKLLRRMGMIRWQSKAVMFDSLSCFMIGLHHFFQFPVAFGGSDIFSRRYLK